VGAGGLDAIASNSLLIALLETGKILGIELERFLACLRAGLLDLVMQNHYKKSSQSIIQLIATGYSSSAA